MYMYVCICIYIYTYTCIHVYKICRCCHPYDHHLCYSLPNGGVCVCVCMCEHMQVAMAFTAKQYDATQRKGVAAGAGASMRARYRSKDTVAATVCLGMRRDHTQCDLTPCDALAQAARAAA